MNLTLNFKPEQKIYRFINNVPIEISDKVALYLEANYNGSFLSVINHVEETKTIPIENENLLFSLMKEEKIDVKKIIEKAIEKNIIIKQGMWYKVEGHSCKGIVKVKELLEKDESILKQIIGKIN